MIKKNKVEDITLLDTVIYEQNTNKYIKGWIWNKCFIWRVPHTVKKTSSLTISLLVYGIKASIYKIEI